MNFIIADDEPIVREGLKTIIDWSALGFTLCDEASDGNEAVDKIMQYNPDLVILDIKMPELSGVKVAEVVRMKGYRGKIIILSGYKDFTYAQAAISHGVESYLVKPIDEDELMEALNRIKLKIERENLAKLYDKSNIVYAKNMMLKHLLIDTNPANGLLGNNQNFEQYELTFSSKPFQLVMIDYSYCASVDISSCHQDWKDMCNNLYAEIIMIDNSILLFLNGTSTIEYFNEHIITYLNNTLHEIPSQPFVIISDSFNEIRLFSKAYQKLKSIAGRRFFYYEDNKPLYCSILADKEEHLSSEKLSPLDFIDNIYLGILHQNSILLNNSVTQLYHVLQNRHFTIEQVYQILINCVLQLKTLFLKTYIKELIEFNETEFINEICNCKTLYEIINLLNVKFTSFCKYTIKPSDVKIIEKVLNYIDLHYNEDLKLEKIADLFGYNPAYLGRLLFDRLGTNFNIYIEKKRLDKAIDMLIHTDIKIPLICNMIGYQNIEYFYRKFKKYTKLTPGTYRAYHYTKQETEGS